ncbi:hypothetical protein AAEU32_11745 [Pseudoalteromonas sp. SSDWG2]|uniref:hypothetical protein n=1 Tax=Pseudoalteromonas sp. SSDWG2 TaxID=3139391 RepID=UPI003BAAA41F
MKQLSSHYTFFYKKVFPVLWFGFIGFFMFNALMIRQEGDVEILFIVVPWGMAVFGYFMMKKFVFDLIDKVFDEGHCLLFVNGNKQVRVRLQDIINVNYELLTNPKRVTISLRNKTEFGAELAFVPKSSFLPFTKNKGIQELIVRIDTLRQ